MVQVLVWRRHKGRKGVYGQAKGQSGADDDGLGKEEDIKLMGSCSFERAISRSFSGFAFSTRELQRAKMATTSTVRYSTVVL
jgi:hypothetical protein